MKLLRLLKELARGYREPEPYVFPDGPALACTESYEEAHRWYEETYLAGEAEQMFDRDMMAGKIPL